MIEPVITDQFALLVSRASAKLLSSLQAVDRNITGVHFYYGRKFDITQIIKGNDESPNEASKASIFPMVWLYVPFREKPSKIDGCAKNVSLNWAVIHNTDSGYTMPQRNSHTFGPILRPIAAEVMRQIDKSGFYHIYDIGQVPHTRFERPMWGTNTNANELIFPVDAIEYSGMELDAYYQDECSQS